MMRWTSHLISFALLALAMLAVTTDATGACRLRSGPDADGRWVVDDGQRRIGYRVSGRPHPRFELRADKMGIVCRGCPPGGTLPLFWQLAGITDVPPSFLTPEGLRQELERAESSKGIKVRPMSNPREIALDSLRGWALPFEHRIEERPADKWTILYGYLGDGCASVVLLADTNPAIHGPALSRLSADEVMRQLVDMLQSVTVARFD